MSQGKYIKGSQINSLAEKQYCAKCREESNPDPKEELPYAKELNDAGKKACYDEYYLGIKLEDQVIPKIGKFEDPRKTVRFKKAYDYAEVLIANNIIPEEFQEYYNNISSQGKSR